MNDAAVAATAHANPFARFAITQEITGHPHFMAQPGRSRHEFLPAALPEYSQELSRHQRARRVNLSER
jgi:hypothetical protein